MKKALCVGVNAYGQGADLAGCINDMNDWSLALQARGFDVETLADDKATGKAIRERLTNLISTAAPGDVLVFQYSGHGSFVPDENADEPDGADECICPVDIWSNGEITDDELRVIYGQRPLGIKLTIISDSCHSGTVSRFAAISTPPTTKGPNPPARKVRFLPPETFLPPKRRDMLGNMRFRRSLPASRHGGLLMSGCADPEYSYDAWFNGRANGAFSYVALQALKSLPAGSTYRRWFSEIRKVLPSSQYPQTPALYGSSTMKSWKVME